MKKEYIASFGIAVLSVGFVTICVLLYFNKNSKWLTARKIKLGALMLTLSATMISCSVGGDEVIMCYSQVADDSTWYENVDTLTVNIESDTFDIIEFPDTNQNIKVYD